MSQAKIDRKLHAQFIAQTDDQIRSGITKILRKKFRNNSSAVKVICRDTGAALRAARNWYDGDNSPSLLYFILLARNYPELLDLFLDLCQRRPERQRKGTGKRNAKAVPPIHTAPPGDEKLTENVPNDVPNQIDTSSCNIRQLWFINTLLEGEKVFAPDIAAHWRVTDKTAMRGMLADRSSIISALAGADAPAAIITQVLDRARAVVVQSETILEDYVQRVNIGPDRIEVKLLLTKLLPEGIELQDIHISQTRTMRMQRRSNEMRLVLDSDSGHTVIDSVLVKGIAQAHVWAEELFSGKADSLVELAERHKVSEG